MATITLNSLTPLHTLPTYFCGMGGQPIFYGSDQADSRYRASLKDLNPEVLRPNPISNMGTPTSSPNGSWTGYRDLALYLGSSFGHVIGLCASPNALPSTKADNDQTNFASDGVGYSPNDIAAWYENFRLAGVNVVGLQMCNEPAIRSQSSHSNAPWFSGAAGSQQGVQHCQAWVAVIHRKYYQAWQAKNSAHSWAMPNVAACVEGATRNYTMTVFKDFAAGVCLSGSSWPYGDNNYSYFDSMDAHAYCDGTNDQGQFNNLFWIPSGSQAVSTSTSTSVMYFLDQMRSYFDANGHPEKGLVWSEGGTPNNNAMAGLKYCAYGVLSFAHQKRYKIDWWTNWSFNAYHGDVNTFGIVDGTSDYHLFPFACMLRDFVFYYSRNYKAQLINVRDQISGSGVTPSTGEPSGLNNSVPRIWASAGLKADGSSLAILIQNIDLTNSENVTINLPVTPVGSITGKHANSGTSVTGSTRCPSITPIAAARNFTVTMEPGSITLLEVPISGSPPPPPPPTNPPSPDNTVITQPGQMIYGSDGSSWTFNSTGQVVANGVVDTTTANVTQMAYEGGKIWQENSNNLWWYKTVPSDTWQPFSGTAVSPIPGSVTPSPDGTVITRPSGTSGAGGWILTDADVTQMGKNYAAGQAEVVAAYNNFKGQADAALSASAHPVTGHPPSGYSTWTWNDGAPNDARNLVYAPALTDAVNSIACAMVWAVLKYSNASVAAQYGARAKYYLQAWQNTYDSAGAPQNMGHNVCEGIPMVKFMIAYDVVRSLFSASEQSAYQSWASHFEPRGKPRSDGQVDGYYNGSYTGEDVTYTPPGKPQETHNWQAWGNNNMTGRTLALAAAATQGGSVLTANLDWQWAHTTPGGHSNAWADLMEGTMFADGMMVEGQGRHSIGYGSWDAIMPMIIAVAAHNAGYLNHDLINYQTATGKNLFLPWLVMGPMIRNAVAWPAWETDFAANPGQIQPTIRAYAQMPDRFVSAGSIKTELDAVVAYGGSSTQGANYDIQWMGYAAVVSKVPPSVQGGAATGGGQIIGSDGTSWSISPAGQILVNGVVDPGTANIVQMAYVGGKVWQENANGYWYYKIVPGDTWLPTQGTTVSPLGAQPTSFPTQPVLDDFNRADGSPGSKWEVISGQPSGMQINQQHFAEGISYTRMAWTTIFGADQQAYFDVSGNFNFEILLRFDNTAKTGYSLQYDASSKTLSINRVVSLTNYVQLSSIVLSTPLAQGDQLGFNVAGTTFTGYINGVSQLTATDSTYNRAGKLGVGF